MPKTPRKQAVSAKKKNMGGAREGAGRPTLDPSGALVPLASRVPGPLLKKFDAWRAKAGLNRSQAVTEAIRRLVESN